jgi:chromosome segregation ATPase
MYTNDDFSRINSEDKKKKRSALQMQIIILESDNRKVLSNKNMLDAEMRKIKMDMDRSQLTLDEKKRKFDRLARDLAQNEEDIKRLRRQLNLV